MNEIYYVTLWLDKEEPGAVFVTTGYYKILKFNLAHSLLSWINQNRDKKFSVDIATCSPIDWS